MNKKVLTLCASLLLAGGLTSQAFAEGFADITTAIQNKTFDANQYYYVNVTTITPNPATSYAAITDEQLDVNGEIGNESAFSTHEENRSTWFRIEAVTKTANGQTSIIGYKLVNALTGKALTVKDENGEGAYDTFYGGASNKLAFVDADGDVIKYFDGRAAVSNNTAALYYLLQAVPVEELECDEVNKVNNGYFGLQFGYINEDGDYVNYEGLQGIDPFVGKLVASNTSFAGDNNAGIRTEIKTATNDSYFIYNETVDAYVVLLKEKWSDYNTNLSPITEEGNGHRFALMTAKQIIEDQTQAKEEDKKIATLSFKVNMPVVVDYSPLEIVAVDAIVNEDGDKVDLEMLISNMASQNYLTTTKAGERTVSGIGEDADLVAIDANYTVVRFADTDYVDMSEFYGWAITIKGLEGEGIEGMTIQPNVKNETNLQPSDIWTKADYVSFSRPEAHWIVTVDNTGVLKLTNRETKASVRWDEAFDMLDNGNTLALRKESGNTYVANLNDKTYKFEINKVAELGKDSWDDYGVYYQDDTETGTTRTYKVTFNDAFGTTSYVGMDGLGNVLLTREESAAINFDLVKTHTTDTLNNDGTIAENAKTDIFQIYNNIMAKNKDGEWELKENGDTLTFFRYKLAIGDKFLNYNEAKKQFELVNEDVVYTEDSKNDDDKVVDYGKSTLADNYVVKLKENNKVNIIKVLNYEMEEINGGEYYDSNSTAKDKMETIYSRYLDSKNKKQALFTADDWANYREGEKVLAEGEMMFFDFNNAEVQKQQNIYAWNANAQLTIAPKEYDSYRYFANPDTVEIYRVEYSDEFLFEHGNILGMTFNRDMYNPSLYLDTAFVRNDTKKPTYMLAVAPEFEPNHTYCPLHGLDADCPAEHLTIIPGYTTARYLVSYTDSVAAHAAELKNEFLHEGQYTKLGFVDAVHRVDSVFVPTMSEENKKAVITEGAILPYTFAFRIVNPETQSFYIEAAKLNDEKNPNSGYKSSWMAWINGCPVLTDDITLAEEFNVRDGEQAPTANEAIEDAASAISVIATDGAVIVKGAEGKNVIVSTILGKVVANETANSDNETIAAPAGIVVVSVDGESFKVAVK